jgi:hypothetical protein
MPTGHQVLAVALVAVSAAPYDYNWEMDTELAASGPTMERFTCDEFPALERDARRAIRLARGQVPVDVVLDRLKTFPLPQSLFHTWDQGLLPTLLADATAWHYQRWQAANAGEQRTATHHTSAH